jgi:lactoylglutathione lyase
MRYLHTMVRVLDLDAALDFYVHGLGLREHARSEHPQGRFTLVFLGTGGDREPFLELTFNWDQAEPYATGRNFGHIALEVEDIHAYCQSLVDKGIAILRPPRDGKMAFVKSPDGVSVEILQCGAALPPAQPWRSMPNAGSW